MPFAPRSRYAWKLRSRTLELGTRTAVMGILNVTPDSFSDGGRFLAVDAAVSQGLAMIEQGAAIIDVGGESTRPGAPPLSPSKEQDRILPVIERLAAAGALVSVDTYHAATAQLAVSTGAEIVNDVSGGLWDQAMLGTCADLRCGVVWMHTRGRPGEWAGLPAMADVVGAVERELKDRVSAGLSAGIAGESVIVDPGFGFGKIDDENYRLLAGLQRIAALGYPVLAGVSCKGFLAKTVAKARNGILPGMEARVIATVAAHTAAVLAGAHLLRVHDVYAAIEGAAVADAILAAADEDAEAYFASAARSSR